MFENRFIIPYIVFDFFLNRISYCILTKLRKYAIIHTEIELIHMYTKKVLIATLIAVAAGTWVGNYISVQKAQKLEVAEHLAWCNSIYHQNVGCPQHGMEVPVAVLKEQEAQHLEWCTRIYHQNVGCPQHGMEVPVAVLKEQEAEHLAWCDRIYHQNVGCPQHGMKVPVAVLKEQEAEHLAWCDRIYHGNVSCPLYRINPLISFIKGEISL